MTSPGLFKWVAVLTGSKNALKGAGFFAGGLLLSVFGFRGALEAMAGGVLVVLLFVLLLVAGLDRSGEAEGAVQRAFCRIRRGINRLSLARLALFAARDVWFVVSVPIFLASVLGWSFTQVGGFMALWVIAYGGVQACRPSCWPRLTGGRAPGPGLRARSAFGLAGDDRADSDWTAAASQSRR